MPIKRPGGKPPREALMHPRHRRDVDDTEDPPIYLHSGNNQSKELFLYFHDEAKTNVVSFLDGNSVLNLKASCRGMHDVFDLYSLDLLKRWNENDTDFIEQHGTVEKFDSEWIPINFHMKARLIRTNHWTNRELAVEYAVGLIEGKISEEQLFDYIGEDGEHLNSSPLTTRMRLILGQQDIFSYPHDLEEEEEEDEEEVREFWTMEILFENWSEDWNLDPDVEESDDEEEDVEESLQSRLMRYVNRISYFNDFDNDDTTSSKIKCDLACILKHTTLVSCVKVHFKYWDSVGTRKDDIMRVFRMRTVIGERSDVFEFIMNKEESD